MAGRTIIWTAKAKRDFTSTLKFYNQRNRNSDYSRKIKSGVVDLVSKLKEHIYLGRPTDIKSIRILVKGYFTIYYEIKELEILILAIWDSRRNPEELNKFIPKN